MNNFTKEQLLKIINAADEVITAQAGTNDHIHPDDSAKMCAAWDYLNDVAAPPVLVKQLAENALAALTAAPVPETGWTGNSAADAALIMLDRINTTDYGDDDRIEGVKRVIRRMAVSPAPVKLPEPFNVFKQAGGVDVAVRSQVTKNHLFGIGYNACIEEVLRLNAIDNTAQQFEALAGWKMVPVEPSKEMLSQIHPVADGNCSHCGNRTTLDCEENMLLSWRDMLEAAPKPEA